MLPIAWQFDYPNLQLRKSKRFISLIFHSFKFSTYVFIMRTLLR